MKTQGETGQEVSLCLQNLLNHFRPGGPVFLPQFHPLPLLLGCPLLCQLSLSLSLLGQSGRVDLGLGLGLQLLQVVYNQ